MNLNEQHKIRVGTCAWDYKEWQGAFYPPDFPRSRWLELYAHYFATVEVDSTFYGAPQTDAVQRWVELTPASFRFVCKMPREITHACKLRDCSAELGAFFRAIEPLGPKLHVVLIQLPPAFSPRDGKTVLRSFVRQLPRDIRFAIEFRNPGWHRPQFIGLLEKFRICWVWADTSPLNERNLAPFEFLPRTTDFLYLRLLGDYSTKYDTDGAIKHQYGKLLWKREAALESWSLKIERHLSEVRNAWIFVSNHFEGFAPETCQRLAEQLGFHLPLPAEGDQVPSTRDKSQLDLFADQEERTT